MNIENLLGIAEQNIASDIYLKAEVPAMMRVNGQVQPIEQAPISAKEIDELAGQILSNKQIEKFNTDKELNLAYESQNKKRYRLNIYLQKSTVSMVFRKVNKSIPTFSELGLPEDLGEISRSRNGLFIICGPTGSGKSTTLASMVDYRSTIAAGHIITIEDPIEYIFEDRKSIVSQREVGIDTLTFENALENALRQAPDVISIGEIRNLETAKAALTMAETGHFVLATLHSSNTYQSLERLIALFPTEQEKQLLLMLAMNLQGIVAQRLLPSSDGKSRVVATELMKSTPQIKDLIKINQISDINPVLRRGEQNGLYTFDQNIFKLYSEGKITKDIALKYSDNPGEITMQFSGFQGTLTQV
jgi:twitching motility protein PilU